MVLDKLSEVFLSFKHGVSIYVVCVLRFSLKTRLFMSVGVFQLFYFICANALNNLLLRKDMCHWSKGMQIRSVTAAGGWGWGGVLVGNLLERRRAQILTLPSFIRNTAGTHIAVEKLPLRPFSFQNNLRHVTILN